jgi:hypothetical protein
MRGDRENLARLAGQVRSGGHVASVVGAADVEALAARGVGASNVMGLVTTGALEALAGLLDAREIIVRSSTPSRWRMPVRRWPPSPRATFWQGRSHRGVATLCRRRHTPRPVRLPPEPWRVCAC